MRRQPVAFALIDAAFLADSKWRALGRRLPDPSAFNSAIGAWLRVLTAARRNGLSEVNALEECEDVTYLADLIAVGLLCAEGIPDKPYRSWAPSRPKYPGEIVTSSTDGTKSTSATIYTDSTPAHASTLLTSLPLPSVIRTNGRAREEVDDGRSDLEAFVLVTRRAPTVKQRRLLDMVLESRDVSGPQWAADIILRHPDDPIGAVIAADKAWRAEQITAAQGAERPKPEPRRRAIGLTGINAELAALLRAQEAVAK